MRLTILACFSLITRFPFLSLSYPKNLVWLTCSLPCSKRRRMPQVEFSEIDRDSSCASELKMDKSTSPLLSSVKMFSFSNITPIPRSLSWRTKLRQSRVFLANREMDFVMIISIFPALQSSIILLNCSRFLVVVPLMPSSA